MNAYSEKLKDPRWQKKRLEIFNRDGFRCVDCLSKDKTLHVHHCLYERGYPWDTANEFLLTVCEECHYERECLEHDCKRALARIFVRIKGGEELRNFVSPFIQLCEDQDSMPGLFNCLNVDFDSDIRWWIYAEENPDFRKMYEDVTGKKIKWGLK